jgi:hypothetical protein
MASDTTGESIDGIPGRMITKHESNARLQKKTLKSIIKIALSVGRAFFMNKTLLMIRLICGR